MGIQVLPAGTRKQSFGERISQGVGRGLQMGSQLMKQHEAAQALKKDNEFLKDLTGRDYSGVKNPKTRELMIAHDLKGQELTQEYGLRKGLEETKQRAKFQEKLNMAKKLGYIDEDIDLENQSSEMDKDFLDDETKQAKGIFKPEFIQQQSQKKSQKSKPKIQKNEEGPPHTGKDIDAMSLMDPTTANNWQRQNEDWYRRQEHAQKLEAKNKEIERKEKLLFHKESEDYDLDLLKANKSSKNQLDSIESSLKSVKAGKIKPGSLTNVFKYFGKVGEKLADAVMTGDEAKLLASVPEFLEGRKELFGVRLSDADLNLLSNKLPDIAKSVEANTQILNLMKKHAKLAQLKYKIGSDIKKTNKGLRPLDYTNQVEERFEEMTKPVRIINPNTGNEVEIPAYEVSKYIEAGGKLVNE